MNLQDIQNISVKHGLDIYGALHPARDDFSQAQTLVLLGSAPTFWDIFTASDMYADGGADPIDRWSEQTITAIAKTLKARAIFPFGGPPYAPFLHWAKASGRAWASPVGMLVHDQTGLMVSYRGALAFDQKLSLPDVDYENPCTSCTDQPCRTACPVGALTDTGYDVPKCVNYMNTERGEDCLNHGCRVRLACPISAGANRQSQQSALHMRAFKEAHA